MKEIMKAIRIYINRVNWKILLLVLMVCYYLAVIINGFLIGNRFTQYRGDYLAFWSVGIIARDKGYSEIYDLHNLQSVQMQAIKSLGFGEHIDSLQIPTRPVPYFSFFVIPFLLLPEVPLKLGFWLWNILSLAILIAYLFFFMQNTFPLSAIKIHVANLLIILLLSYPVFLNFMSGQVEVFLVICIGEFIRYAVSKKPILSGLFLGGLLLKPQLLILIIPIILILRHWKVVYGFLFSSGIIFLISLSLSGTYGMKSLFDLWTKYSVGQATSTPESMINWRMVGINLNMVTNTSNGWVITGLGIALTILAVYYLIKKNPTFGSSQWVLNMLGVFSATLAITWHSHYHMAMVLIPLLAYLSAIQLFPIRILVVWSTFTVIVLSVIIILEIFFQITTRGNHMLFAGVEVAAYSGFALNFVVLVSTLIVPGNQKLQV